MYENERLLVVRWAPKANSMDHLNRVTSHDICKPLLGRLLLTVTPDLARVRQPESCLCLGVVALVCSVDW